jgi:hypothetical protein
VESVAGSHGDSNALASCPTRLLCHGLCSCLSFGYLHHRARHPITFVSSLALKTFPLHTLSVSLQGIACSYEHDAACIMSTAGGVRLALLHSPRSLLQPKTARRLSESRGIRITRKHLHYTTFQIHHGKTADFSESEQAPGSCPASLTISTAEATMYSSAIGHGITCPKARVSEGADSGTNEPTQHASVYHNRASCARHKAD